VTAPIAALVIAGISFGNTSIGTILLAVIVAAGQWRQSRKIAEVHVMVNSQKTEMQARIDGLEEKLRLARIAPAEEE
jgi:hypothetical protein